MPLPAAVLPGSPPRTPLHHPLPLTWDEFLSTAFSALQAHTSSQLSITSLVFRSVAPSTQSTYRSALVTFQRWCVAGTHSHQTLSSEVLDEYLVFLASAHHPAAARSVLAALSLCTTALQGPPVVFTHHWRAVAAIARDADTPVRPTFDISLLGPSHYLSSSRPLRDYGAILLSAVFLLRVSEVTALAPGDFDGGALCIHAAKHGRIANWRGCSPFLAEWLRVLCRDRGPGQTLFDISSATASLRAITPSPTTWHALRRAGALTLLGLGVDPTNLLLWGRWRSAGGVRPYVEERGHAPIPSISSFLGPTGEHRTLALAELWPPSLFGYGRGAAASAAADPPSGGMPRPRPF